MVDPTETTIRLTEAEAEKMIDALMVPRTPSDRAKAAATFARLVFRRSEATNDAAT
jgi:hypothetical protein